MKFIGVHSAPNPPNRDATEEELLADKILAAVSELSSKRDPHPNLTPIKEDLHALKAKLSESNFTVRHLKTRERALQQFIDQFPSMLGYWNKDLVNVHCNKTYAQYFGKVPHEIRGKQIQDLLGKKIFEMNLPHIEAVLRGEPQTFERDIPTPHGVLTTLANYIPHSVNDEVAGFFVIVTNISDRRNLEEKNRQLENSLYEQSRLSSLGQMASGIAHEIINPVTIIYSTACLLLKEMKKQNLERNYVLKGLEEIVTTAERIENIVDGLRSIARGSGDLELVTCDIAQVIEQVVSISRGRFSRASRGLIWRPPQNKVFVECNPVQVSEIILNVVNNAYDAIKDQENGSATISVSHFEDQCQVSIANNGPTIPPEVRVKLFLPFFTTKGKEGTGLGLKLSRDLATANNGSLTISDRNQTEFVLTLKLSSSWQTSEDF